MQPPGAVLAEQSIGPRATGEQAMVEYAPIQCPYCWESIEVPLETEPGDHELVEDCPVCCQPILMRITVGPDRGLQRVAGSRENE